MIGRKIAWYHAQEMLLVNEIQHVIRNRSKHQSKEIAAYNETKDSDHDDLVGMEEYRIS
jgi:hypothetical protein